ncbi:common plant regulatory factor 1-like [Hibiscus syriacus]|uniref:Common plant regulatory factor 1-like n=1 Tax=Hibiscus syriacus TaxID=106335 RepID=A0A6A2YTP7_HIBSY|nr:2-alkenal reductase (NADP(+)-dependent)-like [Hibiscus syriacus]KAE8682756.1 common plant regulatory factor 1-like [Hibiscus syriacus]
MEIINRYITIKNHVDGAPQDSDFKLKSSPLSLSLDPGSHEVIVKNLYVSIDPYLLNRMKSYSFSQQSSAYAVAITPGEDIDAYGVGKVVASGNSKFDKGDIVAGLLKWGEFTVVKPGGMLNKLDLMGFPLSYHVGILGFSGLTAYAGLFEICKPKKGEKVFVSAALGSVGNLVGQFAKVLGCYVVGCAGSNAKVALLKEQLGIDDAFNYREETDLKSTLHRYFPDGIDIYFDNVGGHMQEAVLSNMNINGRIAVCGVISEYTDCGKRAAPSMIDVIYKRIKIQGFLAGDYLNLFGDFLSTTCDYLRTGKIQPLEDISDGVESIPSALINLFGGQNIGKKIVKIAQE